MTLLYITNHFLFYSLYLYMYWFILLPLLLVFYLYSSFKKNKLNTKEIIEPGAVHTYPPAPTLRSQEFRCYKCEKLET